MNVQLVKVAGALFKCSVTLLISICRFVSDTDECVNICPLLCPSQSLRVPRAVTGMHTQLSSPLHERSPCGLSDFTQHEDRNFIANGDKQV